MEAVVALWPAKSEQPEYSFAVGVVTVARICRRPSRYLYVQ